MWPLRTIGFLLMFFGLSASSMIIPVLGLANYMLVYQIYPEHAWWNIPIASLGIRYSMTAAVCLMLGILFNFGRMPSIRPTIHFWDLCALGLVFTVILSEFIGHGSTVQSEVLTDKFVKMMIFVFCLTRVTTTKKNFTIVMWTLVLGSLYIGYDAWTAPKGAFARGRLEVVGGPDFRHSSGLSAHMAAMLPIIAAVFLSTKKWILRPIPMMSGALTVNTIVLCRTRSAFVGLLCGGIVAILMVPRRQKKKVYSALVVAGLCGYALTDNLFWERMKTLQSKETLEQDNAAMGRVEIWKTARTIVAENPLGVGIGNFPIVLAEMNPALGRRAAHNTFVLCTTELGIQGIVLFLALLCTSVYQIFYCYRRAERTTYAAFVRSTCYCLFLSLVVSVSTQMFTERLYTEAFWWILALPSCLQRCVIREMANASAVAPVPLLEDTTDWNERVHTTSPSLAYRSLA
jgi:O-antigen ligase